MNKGFTIIELIVSLAIFAVMTALVVAKYGTFNQGVILTNLAYDVALTIRNAQSYGLNVRNADRLRADQLKNQYNDPYGVHFSQNTTSFIFFVDLPDANGLYNGKYDGASELLTTTNIKNGSMIGTLSCGGCGTPVTSLDIVFQRPDPNANIRQNGSATPVGDADIQVKALDGTIKTVKVRSTGEITVY